MKNWGRVGTNVLSNIPIENNNLHQLKERIILIQYYLIESLLIVLFFWNIFTGRYDSAILSLGLLALVGGAIFICIKGYHEVALFISSSIFIYLSVTKSILPPAFFLSMTPMLLVFIFKTDYLKFLFFGICMITFFALNVSDLYKGSIFILINAIPFSLVIIFNRLLEKQQLALQEAFNQKEKAIEELEEKNEEMNLFTNIMSHDLKTPLRHIQNFSKLLERNIPESDIRKREYLKYILSAQKSMHNLIEDLLTLSRTKSSSLKTQTIDSNELVHQLLGNFQTAIESNQLKVNVNSLPAIEAHPELLTTLLHNLISNAVKYQPKDIPNHIPEVEISYLDTNDYYTFCVKDNGIGVSNADRQKLFEPFKRLHSSAEYEGTGLGLTICQKVVERHKGFIKVCNNDGEGTCFEFGIPKEYGSSKGG